MFCRMNINNDMAEMLAGAANLALAENTKSQYRTAAKHIQRCADHLGQDMSLPFTTGKTFKYVGYLLSIGGVSSATCN